MNAWLNRYLGKIPQAHAYSVIARDGPWMILKRGPTYYWGGDATAYVPVVRFLVHESWASIADHAPLQVWYGVVTKRGKAVLGNVLQRANDHPGPVEDTLRDIAAWLDQVGTRRAIEQSRERAQAEQARIDAETQRMRQSVYKLDFVSASRTEYFGPPKRRRRRKL